MSAPGAPDLAGRLAELADGDGMYYLTQEAAFAPGISGEWPDVIWKPGTPKHKARLVKRQVSPEDLRDLLAEVARLRAEHARLRGQRGGRMNEHAEAICPGCPFGLPAGHRIKEHPVFDSAPPPAEPDTAGKPSEWLPIVCGRCGGHGLEGSYEDADYCGGCDGHGTLPLLGWKTPTNMLPWEGLDDTSF